MQDNVQRPHARIYRHWLDSEPWRGLPGSSVKLLVHLLASWRPNLPPGRGLSDAEGARILVCNPDTAARSIRKLAEAGFIHIPRPGGFTGPRSVRTRAITIATYPAGAFLVPPYSRSPFGRLPQAWLTLPAWRTLPGPAAKLFADMLARHDEGGENIWQMSATTCQERIGCSRATASKALADLQERGWLLPEASLNGSRCFSLSHFPTATRPAEAWRAERWIVPPVFSDALKTGHEHPKKWTP